MEAIKDTISNVMQGLRVKKNSIPQDDPQRLLKKALTKRELGHIKFNYLRKGVLGLNVDSSSWLYHLSLGKEKLLAKLNQQSSAIKDIRFRIGEAR